mmetsp:Transcript_10861/g.24239  ORF Transcript_10861/g.24239 Transcript_10861/m.24239 type:complete len:728 (+) Transcript_10861:318-2501(+)
MDIDDPLWGYQVRCSKTGWLQGFITLTVFTTWTHFFEWNSTHPSSGMAAARVANSLVGRPDPAVYTSEGGETVQQVAARVGQQASDIVRWNHARYSNITVNSRVQPGTALYVLDPVTVDTMAVDRAGETPKKLAARLGLSTADLLELNALKHPSLNPTSKLKLGSELVFRDRAAEPEVFIPNNVEKRALDDDGSLARKLEQQMRHGDPTTTGVVWPRVAEVALLAGLGCGKTLVRLALDELHASKEFDFAVLQATMASVSFYEELGFVRVGAVAIYLQEGTNVDDNPVQGYRHWACADESRPDEFGDTSYMMAIDLATYKDSGLAGKLHRRLVQQWPAVQSCDRRKRGAGNEAVVGGSALQVGDMSLNIADGDDARLQLRYEVEEVLDSRGARHDMEYLVRWKHLSVEDATWEGARSELLSTEAARAAIALFKKPASSRRGTPTVGMPLELTPLGKRERSADVAARLAGASGTSRLTHMVVRSVEAHERTAISPRIFNGGLGEPPALHAGVKAEGSGVLEREHRYWLVVRCSATTGKCTVLPLLSAGRFGGCGRRAGRIRWKPAPPKQGYEREVPRSSLQLVQSEPVTGAREADGEVWCVDDLDVEQAAREQAAAVRNKRRRIFEDVSSVDADVLGVFEQRVKPRKLPVAKRAPLPSDGRGCLPADHVRKRRRLAPASSTCLACTKGKHCAHTCGVRGKVSITGVSPEQSADVMFETTDATALAGPS